MIATDFAANMSEISSLSIFFLENLFLIDIHSLSLARMTSVAVVLIISLLWPQMWAKLQYFNICHGKNQSEKLEPTSGIDQNRTVSAHSTWYGKLIEFNGSMLSFSQPIHKQQSKKGKFDIPHRHFYGNFY